MSTGNQWKREHVAQGLCSACNNPLSPRSKWWCEKHIEQRRKDSAARRASNGKLLSARSVLSSTRARIRAMVMLGGLICSMCGERDFRTLSIDHIDGYKDTGRRQRGFTKTEVYAIIRGASPLSDYRVLCMNCQILHEFERGTRTIYPEVRDAVMAAGGMIGGNADD